MHKTHLRTHTHTHTHTGTPLHVSRILLPRSALLHSHLRPTLRPPSYPYYPIYPIQHIAPYIPVPVPLGLSGKTMSPSEPSIDVMPSILASSAIVMYIC